jgi:hypothetical protein
MFTGGMLLITAGQKLRALRERLGFTIREVEAASLRIAAKHQNDDFGVPLSRLSDIETKGVIPSIFRLYSFSIIYRRDMRELLSWYGIDVNQTAGDLSLSEPPRSHISEALANTTAMHLPVEIDPGFDVRRTTNISRMVQRWGWVPLSHLAHMQPERFIYGYIGSEDLIMSPLLLPGSFVQIDESRNKVQEGPWRSEYERPIYFVETREGFVCSWCAVVGDSLILQPHPLSPVPPRSFRQPNEAEVLGQVIAIAMRLDDWFSTGSSRPPARATRE